MKKNFFAAALILSLGVGSFAACSSDDIPQTEQKKKTTTMMKVALRMPAASGTRATDEPNNYIGEWLGQEKVEGVEVFVFNGIAPTSTLEAHETFTGAQFSATVQGSDFVISPNKGIAVTAGTKQVYVLVNPNAATTAHLGTLTLGTTDINAFEAKYNGVAEVAGAGGVATAPSVAADNSTAGHFAKLDKTGGATANLWKNVIVMTGKNAGASGVAIADNVSEADAVAGIQNLVPITVKRVVARVAVTSSAASFDLKGDDPYTSVVEPAAVLGTVKDFTYVAAQGERKLNFTQKETASGDLTSSNGVQSYKWDSPAYSFVSNDDYGVAGQPNAAAALTNYDYAPLWYKETAGTAGLYGHKVPTNAAITAIVDPLAPSAANAETIGKLMEGDFLLPTTHKYNAAAPTQPAEGYYKGNTAYVLIRTVFTPAKFMEDKDPNEPATGTNRPNRPSATVTTPTDWATLPAAQRPKQLVRGANGKFYSTVFASQDPIYQGVTGQAVEIFQAVVDAANEVQGYKMLYFAWVNPDNVGTSKWYNSAVYRNNIYHVQLDGVTGTGLPWNPLVPATPTVSGDDPNHPNNPDPKPTTPTVTIPTAPGPQTPTTPVTPPVTPPNTPTPVTPSTPLTPNKTFMAVKTTVLPWQVHAYKFPLHNQ